MILHTCRHCDRDVHSPPGLAGQRIDCPYCGRDIVVSAVPLSASPPALQPAAGGTVPKPQTWGQRVGKVFFGLFIVTGATAMTAPPVRAVLDYFASAHWPTGPGMVEKSDVQKVVRRAKGIPITSYKPAISYVYPAGADVYRAATVCFGEEHTLGDGTTEATAKRAAERYPAGRLVKVIYDPHDPRNAVLERRVDSAALLTAVALIPAGLLGVRLFLVGVVPLAFEAGTRWGVFTRRWHWYDVSLFLTFCGCGIWLIALRPFLS